MSYDGGGDLRLFMGASQVFRVYLFPRKHLHRANWFDKQGTLQSRRDVGRMDCRPDLVYADLPISEAEAGPRYSYDDTRNIREMSLNYNYFDMSIHS